VVSSVDMVVPAAQLAPLARWAAEDEQRLAEALQAFSGSRDPDTRFARFAEAVAAAGGGERLPGGGLLVGSLLNFATSPHRLPVVRLAQYARLRRLLGDPATLQGTALELYRESLAFAAGVQSELAATGVPVRDMIDVES